MPINKWQCVEIQGQLKVVPNRFTVNSYEAALPYAEIERMSCFGKCNGLFLIFNFYKHSERKIKHIDLVPLPVVPAITLKVQAAGLSEGARNARCGTDQRNLHHTPGLYASKHQVHVP